MLRIDNLKLPVGASGQAFTRVVFKIKVYD